MSATPRVMNKEALGPEGARWVADALREAMAGGQRVSLALSGGSTTGQVYRELVKQDVPWALVDFYFVDERFVPPDHPDSNYLLAEQTLLKPLGIQPHQVFRMQGERADRDQAARDYEALLPEVLDVVVMGMGEDGHTASLFPGHAALEERQRRVLAVVGPKPPPWRMTLTLPVLQSARKVLGLVNGAGKRDIVARFRAGEDFPAARVTQAQWMMDTAAAGQDDVKGGGAMSTARSSGELAQFGVLGMGVMGQSLALNVADRGFRVSVWDIEPKRFDDVRAKGAPASLQGHAALEDFVASLERPRRILMMVTAGAPVDSVMGRLEPLLQPGDIVLDGGNSWFQDTRRREAAWTQKGLHFLGVGVSGGEEGARHGPSLMPGGPAEAYALVRPVLEAIAARSEGSPCVTHVGPDGAGHFVKMVHNGIEYADMQLLAETYDLLRRGLGLSTDALADLFTQWNQGIAESFLLETTLQVLRKKDPETGKPLVEQVLDKAGQKGTGKWTVQVALDLGVSVPSIAGALDARNLSSLKDERVAASRVLPGPTGESLSADERANLAAWVHDALYAARVATYAQGLRLIQAASREYKWNVSLAEMARIWRAGCIIRAKLLTPLREAFTQQPELSNLMLADNVAPVLEKMAPAWRKTVGVATRLGIPTPVFSASLAYFDSYRSAELPQNLTQAQRDAFGAHTYQRRDRPDAGFVHSDWS
ncbi:NADP-dependent phosphogluconate dehydrogenase [Melittangium boletus]|uniref:6-phosphogluconate dehydrogenase, decarboxylating n=1 Tax=Melittangium boletus DSM 14713 TaxID=1294270 RepID=A0A250II63_9BACT|nr:NADP-dependent phosphogluconate dehydrogenase [Melittangium boletus]ATB30923.1 phosphogluconate dehydrogenase (NADP(+)-dependent, decarboxylating) [Melittangium boletus DSM 14713]